MRRKAKERIMKILPEPDKAALAKMDQPLEPTTFTTEELDPANLRPVCRFGQPTKTY